PDGSTIFDLTPFGGSLFFAAGTAAGQAVWKTDGTEPGTVMVTTPTTSIDIAGATSSFLFFADDTGLWRTAGTPGDAVQLYSNTVDGFGVAGNLLFFAASDPTHGTELWSTDGTVANTAMVKDLRPGVDDSSPVFAASVG